jgi:hypothetical protein
VAVTKTIAGTRNERCGLGATKVAFWLTLLDRLSVADSRLLLTSRAWSDPPLFRSR